jgi:Flp pilus assembly protein TadD
LTYYEKVVAGHGHHVEAFTVMGMLKEQSGDRLGAQQAYERALALDARAGVAANNLALLYASDGSLDEALRLAQSAAEVLHRAR